MADKKIVDGQALEDINGGINYVVNTGDSRNAAIRIAPGLNSAQIGSLPNGTVANTTGNFAKADGRTWAQINYPVNGWIKASILGLDW